MAKEQQVVAVQSVASNPSGVFRPLVIVALMLLGLWMISPMFTSSYVEAYVARLQSMAILNHHGQLALDDQAYPINTEFLYVTRLGMVWLMEGAMLLFHSTELWVLRLITIASFVLLIASSAVFARRWAAVHAWAVIGCVILTPGILEPSFFFADNLVSAALTSLALALVTPRVTAVRWFCVGAIVAGAMLVRLDAVLAVPAIIAVLCLAVPKLRTVVFAVSCGSVGAITVFGVSWKATGVSMLQAMHVGQLFTQVNNNPEIYQTGMAKTCLLIFFGFFGLVTLPLLLLGARQNLKLHSRGWSVVMIALPALFYAAVIPHANEIRDFCIMGAPFVLLHAGTGVQALISALSSPLKILRVGALALLVFFAFVFMAPPYISMRDGPRVLTGRIYNPAFWRQWQGRTLGMVAELRVMTRQIQPGQPVLVISSQFEPERYLHLRLLQEGFTIQPLGNVAAECRSLETFRKGRKTVVSVRTDNPYGIFRGPTAGNLLEAMQIFDSLNCLRDQHFDHSYFFSIGKSGELYWPALAGEEVPIPRRFPLPILHHASYGFFGERELSPQDVNQLRELAQQSLVKNARLASTPISEQEFHARVQHRFWTPPAP